MKKKIVFLSVLIILVMIFLPLAAIFFVPSDAGMGILLLLFFLVNPLLSLFVGGVSGTNVKKLWFFPLICTAAFLIFARILFKMDLEACAVYSIGYLILGFLAMLIYYFISKRKRQ